MATLSPAQIYALARNAGLNPAAATIATAVALGESGGRTDAQGDVGIQTSKWGPSVGLWQIRSVKAQHGTGQTRDASRLTDPAFNAKSMVEISGGGANWRPWTVFTSGAYRKHLAKVTSTVPGAEADPSMLSKILDSLGPGFGGLIPGVTSPGQDMVRAELSDLSKWTTSWGNDAMTVGLKLVAGTAAAALVIAGAVQTVK